MAQEFEEGKQIEEYVNELDSIPIEKEPNQTATQKMETVAEAPVRNEKKPKKQPEPPKQPQPPAAVIVPPQPTPIAPSPQAPPATPAPEPTPVMEPTPEPTTQPPQPTPPQNSPPTYNGIDDYIIKTGQAIGKQTEAQFINTTYRNLVGVINGELMLVPAQQAQQQQPTPEQEPAQAPDPLDTLRRIEVALKDPALKGNVSNIRELLKIKCELLKIEYDESMIVPYLSEHTPQAPPQSPVDSKKAKPKGKWSLKVACALIALSAILGVVVILIIGALAH